MKTGATEEYRLTGPTVSNPFWTKKSHPKVAEKSSQGNLVGFFEGLNARLLTDWTPTFLHCDSSWVDFSGHVRHEISPIWGIERLLLQKSVAFCDFYAGLGDESGSRITKQAPPSGRFSQDTVPPWRRAMDLTKASPKPTPPSRSVAPGKR